MRLHMEQEELGKNTDGLGLEIVIEGLQGDPTENMPGTSIYLEHYQGNVLLHIWTDGKEECQTIILKNKE
jgi:hypothetical protein